MPVHGLASPVLVVCLLTLAGPGLAHAEWPPDGAVLGEVGSLIASDSHSGAFVVGGNPYSLHGLVLHVEASGDPSSDWPIVGIPLDPRNDSGRHASIGAVQAMEDGRGGVFVLTFERGPYPGSGGFLNPFQLYLHRRTSTGDVAPGWPDTGLPVSTWWLWPPYAANNRPIMVPDGEGGVLVVFSDAWTSSRICWVQRVRSDGTALWGEDGAIVRNSTRVGSIPAVAPDGHGGALVFWAEWDDAGSRLSIRAQHFSASGEPLWGPDGRVVSQRMFTDVDQSLTPLVSLSFRSHDAALRALPDQRGGALLAWSGSEGSDLDIYMARVSADGRPSWRDELVVCRAVRRQFQVTMTPGPGRNVILAWVDRRDPAAPAIYAQAVSEAGHALWDTDGVAVATGSGDRGTPLAHADGREGIDIAWYEAGGGGMLRLQRLLMSGRPAPGWPENGYPVSATAHLALGVPLNLQAIDAEPGSVILGWSDVREAPSPPDIEYRTLGMLISPAGPASGPPMPRRERAPAAAAVAGRGDDRTFFVEAESGITAPAGGFVAFRLPEGRHGTLELLDLSGRRVMSRDVGNAGGEVQHLRIADDRGLPAGIYFVRLVEGIRQATARVVVIR